MEIQITTNKFHESNHTTYAESFKSSEYYDLDNSNTHACEQTTSKLRPIATSCAFMNPEYYNLDNNNTQACEQTNSKLRYIATSCAFMNPDLFMKAMSLYLGYQNILKL